VTIKAKLRYMLLVIVILFGAGVTTFFVAVQYFENFVEIKIQNSMKEANLTHLILNKNHHLVMTINEALFNVSTNGIGHALPSLQSVIENTEKLSGKSS
jgi:hypothetical protein